HGTAAAQADGTILYTPAAGFLGTDAFGYTISDGSLTAGATVTVDVSKCPPATDGVFTDDFEPSAEPGWTVQTAVAPAVGTRWTVRTDPLAHSPSRSYFTDAAAPVGEKDDRLIAPPQNLGPQARLIFWHRFVTEATFDGGVLEVSRDAGATWQDVIAAGGSFVQGGYNSTIGTRPGWSGNSPSPNAMSRIEVALSVFAGNGVRISWRLLQDSNSGGVCWWIDDV